MSGSTFKHRRNDYRASTKFPASHANPPNMRVYGHSTVENSISNPAGPRPSTPIGIKSMPRCASTTMSASFPRNANGDNCCFKEACLHHQQQGLPIGCLGNSCSSSAVSSSRAVEKAHEHRHSMQVGLNAGGNRTKPNAALIPQENTLSTAKKILNPTITGESSCSSNISYMDPSTRKILEALDSGELTSSLLDNPFV